MIKRVEKNSRYNSRREQGAVLIYFAAAISLFMLLAAYLLKSAWWQTEKVMIEKICALASIGAVEAYVRETDNTQKLTRATAMAQRIVDENFAAMPVGVFANSAPVAPTVALQTGSWDFVNYPNCSGGCFTIGASPVNAIEVSFSTTVSAEEILGQILPSNPLPVTVASISAANPSYGVVLVEQ